MMPEVKIHYQHLIYKVRMSVCVSLCVCLFTYFSITTQDIKNPKNCFVYMVPGKVFNYFFLTGSAYFRFPQCKPEIQTS